MGAAAARALATAGRRVVLLERHQIGHPLGSSHGAARIFRFSYPEAEYVRMAMASLPMWHALEAEAGEPLLRTTGGLDVRGDTGAHMRALEASGARVEALDATVAEARFGFRAPAGAEILHQPDAGVLSADRCWRALGRLAAKHGAEVREGAAAEALEPSDGGVTVRLAGGARVEARMAVVTAGAWARGLLAGAGVELPVRPTVETVAYFRVPDPARAMPVVEWGEPAVYALPAGDGTVKAGLHGAGPELDPAASERPPPDPEAVAVLGAWIAARYPGAAAQPERTETCVYTNTDDARFVLERHGRIVVGSACSGHGFKFAPWIGERLAELAAEAV